jgi:hypothetical protein
MHLLNQWTDKTPTDFSFEAITPRNFLLLWTVYQILYLRTAIDVSLLQTDPKHAWYAKEIFKMGLFL